MKNGPKQEDHTTRTESDQPQALDDKPPIIQPGPIIIKDGGSVDIQSPIFIFKDDDAKAGRHYKCDRNGKITSIIVMDGLVELPEIKPRNGQTTVVVTFTAT